MSTNNNIKQGTLLARTFLLTVALAAEIASQQLPRPVAIAAYIYNFAKNVEWQDEGGLKEFRFVMYGNDTALLRELHTLAKTKTIRDKPIRVSSTESIGDCSAAQLIFVTKDREPQYVGLFDRIEGKNVLAVTDGFKDRRLIMINFIEPEKGKLRFEINKSNIVNQHLRLMSDMILLGGTTVDVAALYREGQQSLRELQKHSEMLEGELRGLESAIAAKTDEIRIQKDSLLLQTQKIQGQQGILDSQLQEIRKRESELGTQVRKNREQQKLFEARSEEMRKLQADLRKGDGLLKEQQEKIHRQQREIRSKSEVLAEQGATIHRQKNVLYLLVIILVLFALLGHTVYWGYKNKQKLNKALEVKIAELAVAKEHAESADRLKSAFLATMSHELRTPLNSIIGFTGIILQGLVGELTAEQRKQLTMVSESARHLLALINDVLDISKIEAGQLELRNETYPIHESIEKSIRVVEPLAAKKSLTIALDAGQYPLPVYGDRRRIEQVLINLLTNAVKFTDAGRITVSVKSPQGVASSDKIGKDGSLVSISICDTGIGIKAEDREKLFKPFRQIDTGTTRRYEGTGLGLSICKKLAGMLGGDILVQSDGPGKGSTFTFTLLPGEMKNG